MCEREIVCVCVCVQYVCDSGCVWGVSEGVWYVSEGVWYGVSEGMWYVWLCGVCVRVCGMSVYTYICMSVGVVCTIVSLCGMCVCVLSVWGM